MTPQQMNDWRIIPRILIISYSLFFAYSFWWISDWYMNYDFSTVANPTVALAVTGFPVGILGVLSGVWLKIAEHYFKTGGTGNGE